MPETVSFYPTKKLFIEVLTRDISIRDCIFDLLDNSVDSYTRHNVVDTRQIVVSFDSASFSIKDNCGGISKKELLSEVFRLGVVDTATQAKTIGIYGIGLKRSIFKIGTNIVLETDDGSDYCKLVIDDDWLKAEDNWAIPLSETSTSRLDGHKPYTHINITAIREEARDLFVAPFFDAALRKNASIYYSWFINEREIDFVINQEKIPGYEIRVRASDDYKPVRHQENFDGVDIQIMCWIDLTDVEEKRKRLERVEVGWNVFMNKRLIVLGDTSELSGWTGERQYLPRYHPIFNQFRGIVLLSTEEPYKLPVNTLKNNFNPESKVYQHLLTKMCEVARPLVNYLSEKYERSKKRMDNTEATVTRDIKDDVDEQRKHLKESTLTKAEYVTQFVPPPAEEKRRRTDTTIQYTKQKSRVALVKKILDVNSNWQVGSETFEYFWDGEGLDDIK